MKNVNHSNMIDFLLSVQDLGSLPDQLLQELVEEMDTEDRFMLQSQLIQLIFKLKPLLGTVHNSERLYAVH